MRIYRPGQNNQNLISKWFKKILKMFIKSFLFCRCQLSRYDLMGDSNTEQSNLYLKLFNLVFGSMSVYPLENEKMLKPHLHSIVTRPLDLTIKSKEPNDYFLLLRPILCSIWGGNHDLLYQQLLPLIPSLSQSPKELQTVVQKHNI